MNSEEIHFFSKAHNYWVNNNLSLTEKMFNKCLKINPYNGKALISKLLLFFIQNKNKKALELINDIQSLNPDDLTVKDFKKYINEKKEINSFIKTQHFFILKDKLFKDEKFYLTVGRILESGLAFIQKITGKNFSYEFILVEISDKYNAFPNAQFLSRSLMRKICISREDCNEGTLIHELVHTLFPSNNKYLGESLALYIQSVFSDIPSWPFKINEFKEIRTKKKPDIDLMCDYIFNAKYFTMENHINGEILKYYKQAYVFSKYIIDNHGIYKFIDYYEKLKDEEPIEGAENVYQEIFNEPFENKNDSKKTIYKKSENAQVFENEFVYIQRTNILERQNSWSKYIEKLNLYILENKDPDVLCLFFRARLNKLYIIYDEIEVNEDSENINDFLIELDNLKMEIITAKNSYPDNGEFNMCLAETFGLQIRKTAYVNQGKIFFKMQAEINNALKKCPDNFIILLSYCRILLHTPVVFGGNPEEAKIVLDELILENPGSEDVMVWDAFADFKQNDLKSAEKKLNKILQINPNNFSALRIKRKFEEQLQLNNF